MNWRQNNILKEVSDGNFHTLKFYYKKFDVTERTIRNDIKEINSNIKRPPQLTINIDGRVGFEDGEIDYEYISSLFVQENYYTYKLSPEERMTILAMIMLNSNGYRTIMELSERVYLSRNTVLSDMEKTKVWFEENNLQLVSLKRHGFEVSGSEKDIRGGMAKLLLVNRYLIMGTNDSENNIFFRLLMEELDKDELKEEVERIINEKEQEYDLRLTDFSYQDLVYNCLIMINRRRSGKHIGEFSTTDYEKSSKYHFAISLKTAFEEAFGIQICQQEVSELVEILRGQSYIKNNAPGIDKQDLKLRIEEFIQNVSLILKINFHLDFHLYDMLISHMIAAIHRINRGCSLQNPIMAQLKVKYSGVFLAISKSIADLEEYMGNKFNDDEISFIIMYLVSVLEVTRGDKMKIRTLIVCNSGQGTAQLVSRKLQWANRLLIVTDIIASHQLSEWDFTDVDLVVSTISLRDMCVPHIKVSTLITQEELLDIQNLASQIHDEKFHEEYREIELRSEFITLSSSRENKEQRSKTKFKSEKMFSDLLNTKCITLDSEAKDWEDAVTQAGNVMVENGLCTKGYVDAMVKNIETHGPYVVIYPGVAIPHALCEDGVCELGVAILRLKTPVCFGDPKNDPVKYIIPFSLLGADSIDRPLYYFTQMLSSGNLISALDNAQNSKEIIQILTLFEEKYCLRG